MAPKTRAQNLRQSQLSFNPPREPAPLTPPSTSPPSARHRRSTRLTYQSKDSGLFSRGSPSWTAAGRRLQARRENARQARLAVGSSDEEEAREALTEGVGDFAVVRKRAHDEDQDNDDDDGLPVRKDPPRKRSRLALESDDEEEEDDTPVRRRARPANKADEESDDDEEEDEPVAARTPRKKNRRKTLSTQEEEDLREDMDMIRESSPPPPASAAKSKAAARMDALARLRRDRARRSGGRKTTRVISDDDEDIDESVASPIVRRRRDADADECLSSSDDDANRRDAIDPDEALPDDDDFVVEDEELGVPLNDIPIEFTSWASAKPKELFRHAIDFLVQLRLNPAFPSRDEIYRVAWQKLDDQVQGLVGSKYSSSAWKRDFHVALHARPSRETAEMPGWDEDCQACGRSGYTATRRVRFLGAPYERWGLEDLEQREEDEEAGIVRDGQGREVPDESTVYSLGKQCFKNAVAAHTLEHWRRDLRDEVWARLEGMGELAPEKILERDGLSGRRRREYANRVVDRMEGEGMVRELYQVYKDTTEQARTAEVSLFPAFAEAGLTVVEFRVYLARFVAD